MAAYQSIQTIFLRLKVVVSFGDDRKIPLRLSHTVSLLCSQSHIGRDGIFFLICRCTRRLYLIINLYSRSNPSWANLG